MFFRIFQHLLPRSEAWKIRQVSKTWTIGDGHSIGDTGLVIGGRTSGPHLSRFFEGLADALEPIRGFFDGIFAAAFPSSTGELAEWESQFGLTANPSDAIRRQNLAAEWAATGGQSLSYIQGVLQTAGFPVYVHEWWASGPPYIARDPRVYTLEPLVGTVQCGEPLAQCGEPLAQCNRFLRNDPHYIVNLTLTDEAPPQIPDDPLSWPYFFYLAGPSFEVVPIPSGRRAEFERLLLKLRPQQHWIVTVIDYV